MFPPMGHNYTHHQPIHAPQPHDAIHQTNCPKAINVRTLIQKSDGSVIFMAFKKLLKNNLTTNIELSIVINKT